MDQLVSKLNSASFKAKFEIPDHESEFFQKVC